MDVYEQLVCSSINGSCITSPGKYLQNWAHFPILAHHHRNWSPTPSPVASLVRTTRDHCCLTTMFLQVHAYFPEMNITVLKD